MRLTPDLVRENQKTRLALIPGIAWPCNTLGNHDSPRVYNRFGDGIHNDALARLNLVLLLTLKARRSCTTGRDRNERLSADRHRRRPRPAGPAVLPLFQKKICACRKRKRCGGLCLSAATRPHPNQWRMRLTPGSHPPGCAPGCRQSQFCCRNQRRGSG